ncbi:Catabolic 3-dehydroquinate dehydratase [Methanimicrococcus hongohii]|uniref:3-dehydroquinate dehydratase n=1 Tax=Methanimicrococcus hongohii TaxID=3028295 RepID=A0AA96ZUI2_9EURY|nr:type I 3-dehydroquinate dehydratase [Methanimicrococcus sp. Hf6]WNY23797.1 Catabolic 3-dehydroquinate dehydratase [Methanimicrococcus sp. Hf6]
MTYFTRPAIVGTITKNVKENAKIGKESGADILEIRFDLLLAHTSGFEKYLKKDFEETALVEQLKSWIKEAKEAGLPVIGTLRSKDEGGAFEGSESERFYIIREFIADVDFADIERRSSKKEIYECKIIAEKSDTKIIISSHFFDEKDMPSVKKIGKVLKKSFERGADIAKVAVMPESKNDVLKLYEAGLKSKTPEKICLIAMGELGKQTRILAPFYGSILSYGYIDEEAAPGQLPVGEIKEGFRLLGLL